MGRTKSELINYLMSNGRASDLLAMMEGTSVYTNENSEGAPQDRTLGRLWTAALYHLRFVAEFGNRSDGVMKDGKWLTPFPDEFSEWMEAGSPGISLNDLDRYFRDNPLS